MVQFKNFTPESNGPVRFSFIKIPFPYQRKSGILKNGQDPFFVGLCRVVRACNLLANATGKLARKMKSFSEGRVEGLGNAIGVQFFGIENQRREPVQGLEVIFDYLRGLVGPFYFDFESSDGFHYYLPLVV